MFLHTVIILCCISCVLSSIQFTFSANEIKKNKLSAEQGVYTIVSFHFPFCDIIFSEDTDTNTYSLENLIPPASVRYSWLLHRHRSRFPASRFRVPIRKYFQCVIIISVMNEGITYLSKFEDLFITGFGAPTQADQDYYIFITRENYVNPILNSRTSKLIKFKVAIPLDSRSGKPVNGFSLCFYCRANEVQGHHDHEALVYSQVVTIDLVTSIASLDALFPDFTLNGNGYALRTTSPTKYKFTTEIVEIRPGKWQLIRGVSKSIMDNVLPHYNFTYVVFSSPTGDTGGPTDKNGTVWDGCIGQLMAGEADLSLTTSPNRARFLVIGFSAAAFYVWVSFTVGQPKMILYSWKAIFWPFTKELWLAVIVSLLAVICVFKSFKRHDIRQGVGSIHQNLINEMTFSLIGRYVQDPKTVHCRLLLFVWVLAGLVLSTLYTSKIVGLFAQPIYETPPRTFEDLANSKYSIGMDYSGGSLFAYFQTSTSPIFQKMFSKFEKPKDTVACFEAATNSKFACITWNGVADYVGWSNLTIVNGRSPLLRATDVTYFTWTGLAMPRNAVFKPNFDKTISMIYDTGHGNQWIINDLKGLQRSYLNWQQRELNKEVVRYNDDGPVLLKFSNILGVFYIFGVGHTVAFLGFFAEKSVAYVVKN